MWSLRFAQVKDRAERVTVVELKSGMHIVGNVRRSIVTVEFVVTVVVPMLTIVVVVGKIVRLLVLSLC